MQVNGAALFSREACTYSTAPRPKAEKRHQCGDAKPLASRKGFYAPDRHESRSDFDSKDLSELGQQVLIRRLLWEAMIMENYEALLPESTVTAFASKEIFGASDKRRAFVCAFRVYGDSGQYGLHAGAIGYSGFASPALL
jgi:hypothetical protein